MSRSLESAVRTILKYIGDDPKRKGILQTPKRLEKSLLDLTKGLREDINSVIEGAVFEDAYDEMVLVKDIDFFSLCEHHLLPFFGKCHVAYIPNGKIIGLSKIPRIVDHFSKRLQVQERLTTEIANCLKNAIKPRGVGVVMEAYHLCMMMRGVEKQNCKATSSCMLGGFKKDPRTRNEFLHLIETHLLGNL